MSENKENVLFETITIEKFKNGERIKFMSFTVKAAEKSDLTQMIMKLLVTIAEKKGYFQYFDNNVADPLAVDESVKKKNIITVLNKYFEETADKELNGNDLYNYMLENGAQLPFTLKYQENE